MCKIRIVSERWPLIALSFRWRAGVPAAGQALAAVGAGDQPVLSRPRPRPGAPGVARPARPPGQLGVERRSTSRRVDDQQRNHARRSAKIRRGRSRRRPARPPGPPGTPRPGRTWPGSPGAARRRLLGPGVPGPARPPPARNRSPRPATVGSPGLARPGHRPAAGALAPNRPSGHCSCLAASSSGIPPVCRLYLALTSSPGHRCSIVLPLFTARHPKRLGRRGPTRGAVPPDRDDVAAGRAEVRRVLRVDPGLGQGARRPRRARSGGRHSRRRVTSTSSPKLA